MKRGASCVLLALCLLVSPVRCRSAATSGSGHASASPASPVRSTTLSSDWLRLDSGGLHLVGRVSQSDLQSVAQALDVFRSAFSRLHPRFTMTSDVPVFVVLLPDPHALVPFRPRDAKGRRRDNVGGYLARSGDVAYVACPIRPGPKTKIGLSVAYHELTHLFLSRNLQELPLWLDEGLSSFYETFEVQLDGTRGMLGRPIPHYTEWVRNEPLIPLSRLLSRNQAYQLIRDRRTATMFYAESWALVHYLLLSRPPDRRGDIDQYMRAIDNGMSVEQAFNSAFGTTFSDMERQLASYVSRSDWPVWLFDAPTGSAPVGAPEPMAAADAEFVQGDLLFRVGAFDDAGRTLLRALAQEPSHVAAAASLGGVRSAQERHAEAIELLQTAAKADPRRFGTQLLLGSALMRHERYEEAWQAFARATSLNGAAAGGWQGRCLAAAALGREEESNDALRRWFSLERDDAAYRGRAVAAYRARQFALAANDSKSYVSRAGRASEGAPYAAFLGALALTRLGATDEARHLLAEVSSEIPAMAWPAKVMAFMQGQMSSEALVSQAKDAGQRTEARYYAGARAAAAGRTTEAVRELGWVVSKGDRDYVEYTLAKCELEWLRGDATQQNRMRSVLRGATASQAGF